MLSRVLVELVSKVIAVALVTVVTVGVVENGVGGGGMGKGGAAVSEEQKLVARRGEEGVPVSKGPASKVLASEVLASKGPASNVPASTVPASKSPVDTVPVDRVQVDDDAHWTAVVLARRGRGLRKVCVRGCGRERAGAKGVQNALEQVRCARGRSSDWTATIPSAK